MEIASFLRAHIRKNTKGYKKRIPLFYFLHFVLETPAYTDLACWSDYVPFHFRINSPVKLAALWGLAKGKQNMTYAKLGRAIRYYYGKNVIEKVDNQDFVYRFVLSSKTEGMLRQNIKHWQQVSTQFVALTIQMGRLRKSSDGEENESDCDEYLDLVKHEDSIETDDSSWTNLFDTSCFLLPTSIHDSSKMLTNDGSKSQNLDKGAENGSSGVVTDILESGSASDVYKSPDAPLITFFPDQFLDMLDEV